MSHHLSRLEAATGGTLVQRVGRGIRLTPEGELLANEATEIVGRVEAAANELAAQVGLRTGRVRLAANARRIRARAERDRPSSGRALEMLRHGEVDAALMFRYAHAPLEEEGFRMVHVADDPIYLVSQRPDDSVANVCDDMVVVQALVAAGIGVTTLPGLALREHRLPDVHHRDTRLPPPDLHRHLRRTTRPHPPPSR